MNDHDDVDDDPFDTGLPMGDPYLAYLLGKGRRNVRLLFRDAQSENIRTPVLIGFRQTGLGALASGADFVDEARQETWRDGTVFPAFIATLNDLTRRLQDGYGNAEGVVDRAGVTMALASDAALEAYREEAADPASPVRTRIFWVAPGPGIDPEEGFEPDPDKAGQAPGWPEIDDDIRRDGLDPFYANLAAAGRDPTDLRALRHVHVEGEEDFTVTAVIDDGIAFANGRFRGRGGAGVGKTAFQALWLQFATTGLDYSRGQIRDLLKAGSLPSRFSEERVYRAARILDYSRSLRHTLGYPSTHGTAVLDTAAGAPATTGAELNRKALMAVQVPSEAVRDTSLSRLHPYFLAGIFYLLLRLVVFTLKLRFPGPAEGHGGYPALEGEVDTITMRPMVINLSFGNTAGPHDGRSPFELGLDRIIGFWCAFAGPLAIVLPSGNSHLARGHARGALTAEDPAWTIPWRVQPDDRTDSAVEVWLPPLGGAVGNPRVRIRARPPGAPAGSPGTGWLAEFGSAPVRIETPAGEAICEIGYRFNPLDGRGVFDVFLAPTATYRSRASGAPEGAVAASGVWSIELERLPAAPAALHLAAWVQRDDTPFNYRRLGRQSYFDAACHDPYERPSGRPKTDDDADCLVRRAGNMSAIATGCRPAVVGGAIDREGYGGARRYAAAPYSAGGPVLTPPAACAPEPDRTGPDVVCRSEASPVLHGIMAAGTLSGSISRFGGTSLAAPQASGHLVAIARAGDTPDRTALRDEALPIVEGPATRVGEGFVEYATAYLDRRNPARS